MSECLYEAMSVMEKQSRLFHSLHNFLKRDYSEDVRVLNQILSKSETADLRPEAPPIPFTGNPWSKVKNECTLLVGINPKWHEPGSKTGQYECEISKSIELIDRFRDGDNNAFNEYINQRNNYFQEGFEYGGHFTYIANRFIENWYNTDKNSLWEKYLMNLDVLPWFSDKTKGISNEKLVSEYTMNNALIEYMDVIENLVDLIRPARIQLNGVPPRLVFEQVFGIKSRPLLLIDESIGMYVGYLKIKNKEYPVLAHNFGKTQSGPNSKVQWENMANKYNQWLNNKI